VRQRAQQLRAALRPLAQQRQDLLAKQLGVGAPLGHLPQRPGQQRVPVPAGDAVAVELPLADQVERSPHQRGLEHAAVNHRGLQLLAPEAAEARPEPDVRRRRVLRLHARQPLDGGRDVELGPLQEQLPGQRPAVELARADQGHPA
jgi:hypothetical protein